MATGSASPLLVPGYQDQGQGQGQVQVHAQKRSLCREDDRPKSESPVKKPKTRSGLEELETVLPAKYHRVLRQNEPLFASVLAAVKAHMARYDLSHDIKHILRVVALCGRILDAEADTTTESGIRNEGVKYDAKIVFLSALLHDIPDPKYTPPSQNPTAALTSILHCSGACPSLIIAVTRIATHISYKLESRNPGAVQTVLEQYPELAIVQDADRLDALGAIGVARVFAFGGAMRPLSDLEGCLEYLVERGDGVEGCMKTQAGRNLARERARRIRVYRGWWEEEML